MLFQAPVSDLGKTLVRGKGRHIVIAMRIPPRWIRTELRDEYVGALAPARDLLDDFLREKRKRGGDHNAAFDALRYEERFDLSLEGVTELKRMAGMSRRKDVVLCCQCGPGERCHRDLLLLLGQAWFGARTGRPRFAYPRFRSRLHADGE